MRGGLNGLAQNETKLASYHNTPFTKVCLGMTANDVTNWILVNNAATSLYSLLADGAYRETNAGRAEWLSLVNDASLQPYCNKEGFNVFYFYGNSKRQLRIGILGNNQNNCGSCNSFIGFGFGVVYWPKWSSGSFHYTEFVNVQFETFGYIFVQ